MGFKKILWAADSDWENCVRSQGAYFEGDRGVIALCTMFLVSCIFDKYLYFSYYLANTSWTDLVYMHHIELFILNFDGHFVAGKRSF